MSATHILCLSETHTHIQVYLHTQVIVTANAGDSDVCLLRFATQGGSQLMTTEWLSKEHSLHNVQVYSLPH